ncbi:MAG TPA: hypothetical protein VMR50_04175 [Myxococcota bacterium]|nr:hypothetical protein [Myxococcota bacterium]
MRGWIALLLGVVALGCATQPVLTPDSRFAANDGLVVLRVVSNLEYPGWYRLTLKADGSTDSFQLNPVPYAVQGSYVFAALLPQGLYTPDQLLGGRNEGSYVYQVTAPLTTQLGTFRVEPGRVTNLGTLVYQPGTKLDKQGSQFWVALDPTPAPARELLRAHYANLAEAVSGKPELGWASQRAVAERPAILSAARASARALNGAVVTPGNTVYAGGRLGQVFVGPELGSRWLRLDTGSVHELLCVLPLGDGRILAGGEEGLLVYSQDGGKAWRPVALAHPNEMVSYLAAAPDRTLYLVAESETDTVIYTSSDPAAGWHELKRFGPLPEGSLWWGPQSWKEKRTPSGATLRAQPYALTARALFVLRQPKTIYRYDLQERRWDESDSAPAPIFSIETTGDGYLFAIPVGGLKMFGSPDGGKTWQSREYFALHVPPAFADRDHGYMAALPYGLTQSWRTMKTTDGGSSWTESGKLPANTYAERLVLDPSGKKLIALTPSHQLYVSSDDGQTWLGPR